MSGKLRSRPHVAERDFAEWYYTPHTLAAGLCSAFVVLATVLLRESGNAEANVKHGLAACVVIFTVFGAVHLPDGIVLRPHPAVWRAVLAIALVYLLFLVFMLFQDLETVRSIFGYYDAGLLLPPAEESYATDCRMSTEEEPHKFWNTVADVFLIAHLGGYWAKTLVLRDWRVVTAVSIGFEIIEVTGQHVLPNFAECWWDHLLVDVLICNGGGTVLGLLTLRAVNAKDYHWVQLRDIKSVSGKARRVLGQFTPRDGLVRYRWNMFDSPKRFFQVAILLAVMFLQEVNCFMMKSILNMKPSYHLVPLRLALWGVIAIPGVREFYDYVSEPTTKRIGTTAWVGTLALAFETLWIWKMAFHGGYFRQPMPLTVYYPWAWSLCAGTVWLAMFFGLAQYRRKSALLRGALNVLFYSIPVALTGMFAMTNKDLEYGKDAFTEWVS